MSLSGDDVDAVTLEDLDALWLGSVVLSQGVAYQRYGNAEWAAEGCWHETSQIPLPAKVLHSTNPYTEATK